MKIIWREERNLCVERTKEHARRHSTWNTPRGKLTWQQCTATHTHVPNVHRLTFTVSHYATNPSTVWYNKYTIKQIDGHTIEELTLHSLLESRSMFRFINKLNISHFLLDCISFELCLPFVVLHQFKRICAYAPRSSFVWRLGNFHPPAPPSLHSFGSSVNSIHPHRHLPFACQIEHHIYR